MKCARCNKPKNARCNKPKNRVNGYCSTTCEDLADVEAEVRAFSAYVGKLEAERDALRAERDRLAGLRDVVIGQAKWTGDQTTAGPLIDRVLVAEAERDMLRAENVRLWKALDRAGILPDPSTSEGRMFQAIDEWEKAEALADEVERERYQPYRDSGSR